MSYVALWKKVLDFVLAIIGATIAVPIIGICALMIKISSPGPVFFLQERVGLDGKPFLIFKLRTMAVNPDRREKQTQISDPEVFPVGKIFRRLKIDELPQLFNVLRGDMSWVGPRPSLIETFNEMPEWARKRVSVRPGITGLAQVNGNVALSWEERWKHDLKYTETISFLTDLKILWKTVAVVVLSEEQFRRTL